MTVPPFMKSSANTVYKHFASNPGKLLLITGTIGWILSAVAQVTAVVVNPKIPMDQKKFLIPQELADAAVNIASFFIITRSCTQLGEGFVKSGKLATPKIREHLAKLHLDSKAGTKGFNILKQPEMQELNPKFNKELQKDYFNFADGISFISSTIGSIISCNVITPILRNKIASAQQKQSIAEDKMNAASLRISSAPVLPAQNTFNQQKSATFNAPIRPTSGSMRV